jgi:probable rRNA maturation factor
MALFALPVTEVLVVAECWQAEPDSEAVIHRAITAAAEMVNAGIGEAELAVMLTDDAGIRTLNKNWRGQAIAYETTRREADDEQKPFDHHLSHLAVHGFLHLVGYDHEQDNDAEAMEDLEREILEVIGIPDPYADQDRMT